VVSLFHSFGHGGVTYHVDVDEIRLPIDTAIPCGLIINELITNALKHAFPDGRLGRITVALHQQGPDRLLLEVQDDGIGLPEDLRPAEAKSLGLHLVSILTRQLNGDLEIRRENGTLFRVRFGITAPDSEGSKAQQTSVEKG
jgi:two-component sensor histidine kinase